MSKSIFVFCCFCISMFSFSADAADTSVHGLSCQKGELADHYAERYSKAWSSGLADAFVKMQTQSLEEFLGKQLSRSQTEQLAAGYRLLVKKYYSKEAWLPGVRNYVNDNLTLEEQCSALAFFRTHAGSKVLEMQVTPGGSEWIRQQATNSVKASKTFESDTKTMLSEVFPEIKESILLFKPLL